LKYQNTLPCQAKRMHITVSLLHNNLSLAFVTKEIQTIKHGQARQDRLAQPMLLGLHRQEWCHRQDLQAQSLQQQVFAQVCPDPDKSLQLIVDSQKYQAR